MSDEIKKPRAKPRPRDYGLLMMVQVIVPVDRNSLDSTISVSSAVKEAQATGGLDGILKLPGVRFALTARPPRFGTLPRPGEPAQATMDDDGNGEQFDTEDAKRSEAAPEPGHLGQQQTEETEEAATGGNGKRRGARAS